MQKLMSTISSLRSALQLLIREAPDIQRVVLILGGSPLRPQKAYELLFTRGDNGLSFEGDFSKSKATEALSKKTIRALISTGAGSTSCPGPMRLFVLVQAPPSLNLPQHFLPKRDFRYNRKFVPLKLRFKCKTQDNETNSPFNSGTNDLICLRSALQLLIREAPDIQRVVLILGGSPLRPQKAYELLFTRGDNGLSFEGDFSKSKATEALSKKTIRALISTGAGSTSCPGPMRLFVLVQAPPSLNLPQHFLPKRDFRYNRKFVPLKLRFKCKTQDNETNSPFNSGTNDLIWFQCRHVIKGLAFQQPVEE
ncbi:hypothetical protein F2Q68_00038198 [Brassica cretica]|uniref:Uncharacterized protein n=1 Tax=Brassica cretica TaxID=69181 RepID=A0A8S9MAW0_BRACR|nr:hypothetical protein F2Q68_00038198 [Brassica cretica]